MSGRTPFEAARFDTSKGRLYYKEGLEGSALRRSGFEGARLRRAAAAPIESRLWPLEAIHLP